MEENKEVFNSQEEVIRCLSELKNSPFGEGQYQLDLINLCGSIVVIANDSCRTLDTLRETGTDFKYIESIQDRLFQICTISDVIKEKINTDDFTHLQDLIYFYNKQIKENDPSN